MLPYDSFPLPRRLVIGDATVLLLLLFSLSGSVVQSLHSLSLSNPVQCPVQRSGHTVNCFYHEICHNGSMFVIKTDNVSAQEAKHGVYPEQDAYHLHVGSNPIWQWRADADALIPPQNHVTGYHHNINYRFQTPQWLADIAVTTGVKILTMPEGMVLMYPHNPLRSLFINIFHAGELLFSLMDYVTDRATGNYDEISHPPGIFSFFPLDSFLGKNRTIGDYSWQTQFLEVVLNIMLDFSDTKEPFPLASEVLNRTGLPFFTSKDLYSHGINNHDNDVMNNWMCFPRSVLLGFKQIGSWDGWLSQHMFLNKLNEMHGEYFASKPGPQMHMLPVPVIFISRKSRGVLNEEELMQAINKTNWTTLVHVPYVGALNFFEQAKLFATAPIVVSPHGSELANIWFMQPNSAVIEMMPPSFLYGGTVCYRLMADGLGLVYHQIRGNLSKAIEKEGLTEQQRVCLDKMEAEDEKQGGGFNWRDVDCHHKLKGFSFEIDVDLFLQALEATRRQLVLRNF